MKKILLTCSLIGTFSLSLMAKAYIVTGNNAAKKVTNAVLVRYNDRSPLPNYVQFAQFRPLPQAKFQSWIQQFFKERSETSFTLVKTTKDQIGFTHNEYQEKVNNIPIQFGRVKTHIKGGMIYSFSGELYPANVNTSTAALTEQAALQKALNHIGAQKYMWQLPGNNEALKTRMNNPKATFNPVGSLVYIYKDNKPSDQLRLAYKFNIYAAKPLSRTMVWVDAQTGEILYTEDLIWEINNSNATAQTGYSGTQNIVTDSVSPNSFRLRETGRDAGVEIETFNLQTGTNYGAAVDFTDADNYWNNVNAQEDQYATDAHWGAEKTVDYYWQKHNRNSIDGNGMTVLGYVHYDVNYLNAFWDGTEMTYGDGSGSYTPLTTIDVAGHEMTHGVTGNTANLNYQDESGALNESFSDCFGNTIEHWAKPLTASWLIGEGMGGAPFRNMANPNQYQQPDTYLGTYWYTGTGDNGGVHTNSGVQNYWYYLEVEGGSGTNDNNDSYNVTGLGWDTAADITYRNLTVYLSANSQYADARFYAIQSAQDLYGGCSQAVETTTNAWYAVGVGNPYSATVTAAFTSSDTAGCSIPFTVQFTNNSTNGSSYYWDFGDGDTSSTANPAHTYTAYGNYTVKLITDGGACGTDSIILTNYVVVDSTIPCVAILPPTGSAATQTGCAGEVYDDGGPSGNYSNYDSSTITISPTGASYVTLTVNSFDVEANSGGGCYDYLYIYDGPSTASPLIGSYCDNNPPPTTIQSTSGSITIAFVSDMSVNYSGFDISWQCSMPVTPPVAQFTANATSTCDGTVQFTDQSTNGPTAWHWDFGDGDTSNVQNPTHTYLASGTYTVSLTASNSYGNNQSIQNNYIVVNLPQTPTAIPDTVCLNDPATLFATSGTGQIQWFADANGDTLLGTGNSYTTQPLSTDSTLYVSDVITHPIQSLGPIDNTIGGGNNYQYNNYLIFDVYTPITLVSVKVYAVNAVTRTFQLRDVNSNVLQSKVVNIPASATNGYVVPLNFDITPGTGYQLAVAGTDAELYRNNSGATYPYTLAGYASITGNSAPGAPNYYYMFYDWKIRKQNCESTPIAVTAHVKDCSADGNGIENYSLSQSVNIYPNPAGNTFNVAVNNINEPILISVYNEVGQLVLSSKINKSGITQLSANSLAEGVYNIRLRGLHTNTSAYKRLVIIK